MTLRQRHIDMAIKEKDRFEDAFPTKNIEFSISCYWYFAGGTCLCKLQEIQQVFFNKKLSPPYEPIEDQIGNLPPISSSKFY